jgi:hypothetical protein
MHNILACRSTQEQSIDVLMGCAAACRENTGLEDGPRPACCMQGLGNIDEDESTEIEPGYASRVHRIFFTRS